MHEFRETRRIPRQCGGKNSLGGKSPMGLSSPRVRPVAHSNLSAEALRPGLRTIWQFFRFSPEGVFRRVAKPAVAQQLSAHPDLAVLLPNSVGCGYFVLQGIVRCSTFVTRLVNKVDLSAARCRSGREFAEKACLGEREDVSLVYPDLRGDTKVLGEYCARAPGNHPRPSTSRLWKAVLGK